MSWQTALRRTVKPVQLFARPKITPKTIDLNRVVTVDFETFFSQDYTLRKLSTSEYVRHPEFKVQMVGIKIGRKPTKIYDAEKGRKALQAINWATHSLCCHNTAFDGFILSHHWGIKPAYYHDTLSMARGLHSNEIDGDLDSVAKFYGGVGKVEGFLEKTKGVRDWSPALFKEGAVYCAQDIDECFRIFTQMVPKLPADEMDIIDLVIRMFCDPVLKVDIPRVQAEYERELERREKLFFNAVPPDQYDVGGLHYDEAFFKKSILKTGAERALEDTDRRMMISKRLLGNNEFFADLLRKLDITPPIKISPAWMKKSASERDEEGKFVYAFAKDDPAFVNLPDDVDAWRGTLRQDRKTDVLKIAAKRTRIETLIQARLAVKSTGNVTRAERFLEAGKDNMPLPVGYAYSRAHTHRLGGNNKMNCLPGESEVLTPDGWIRLDKFPENGGVAAVWDATTSNIEFAPVGLFKKMYSGPMVRARTRTRTHDALYTPDHGLPVITYRSKEAVRRTAEEMIGQRDWLLPVSGFLQGKDPLAISPALARFAAAVQADGSIVPNSEHSTAVQFSFKKERKVRRFKQLCEDAGIRYTETAGEEGYTKFYVNHGQAPNDMFKVFGAWLLKLSPEALTALVDEAAHWDGHVRGRSYLYSSAIKANVEWLQTAAHLVGRSAQTFEVNNCRGWNTNPDAKLWTMNVKPRGYVLNEREREPLKLTKGVTQEVFCLTTPTGWFLMRHNGTIHVTGNCQNLPRGGELRKSILAPEGYRLVVCDSGQIECRTAAWLWGQTDLLDAFRVADTFEEEQAKLPKEKRRKPDIHERDAYCRFADNIYGRVITKDDKTERFVGKVATLGLQFGLGAQKLQMILAKGALGGPPVFFDINTCHRIVNTYRSTNFKIREGWGICNRIIEDMARGRQGSHGPISWEANTIWLPNGMALNYPGLRLTHNEEKGWDEWSYQAKDITTKIYGGLLTENLVQALARIIVMTQMLHISHKYRVVMTTHDEVVTLAKEKEADKCLEFMLKEMKTPLPWCPDLKLNAEGGHDINYSK